MTHKCVTLICLTVTSVKSNIGGRLGWLGIIVNTNIHGKFQKVPTLGEKTTFNYFTIPLIPNGLI